MGREGREGGREKTCEEEDEEVVLIRLSWHCLNLRILLVVRAGVSNRGERTT